MRKGPQVTYQVSPEFREYTMNAIEKATAATATTLSRTQRGRLTVCRSRTAHHSCAAAEKAYGMAAVMPVIKTRVVNTAAPLAPRKLTTTASEANAVELTMPKTG